MRENNLIWNRKTFDLCRNVCLQELVKLTFTHKLQINYLQKDNWAYLLKCWHATHHVKFYTCNNSTPKGIPACVGASKCDHMPFIDKPAWSASENFLLFWTIFCPFTSLTTLKIKFLKKWKKKSLEISSIYTCVPKIVITWRMIPEIWCITVGQTDKQKKWHIEVGAPSKKPTLSLSLEPEPFDAGGTHMCAFLVTKKITSFLHHLILFWLYNSIA